MVRCAYKSVQSGPSSTISFGRAGAVNVAIQEASGCFAWWAGCTVLVLATRRGGLLTAGRLWCRFGCCARCARYAVCAGACAAAACRAGGTAGGGVPADRAAAGAGGGAGAPGRARLLDLLEAAVVGQPV